MPCSSILILSNFAKKLTGEVISIYRLISLCGERTLPESKVGKVQGCESTLSYYAGMDHQTPFFPYVQTILYFVTF